jgi:prefoldin subunit 5
MNFIHQNSKRNLRQTRYLTANHLEEINETVNILSNGIEMLDDDLKRLDMESNQCQNVLQPITNQFPILKKSIDEQNDFVDSIKPNQENVERDISFMKQKLDEIKSVSYDGTYIWKITNVQEKIG